MNEDFGPEELKEAMHEMYRQLQKELERKLEEADFVKVQMRVVEATQGLLYEIDRLNDEINAQQEEID